jgi:hypothetical protein
MRFDLTGSSENAFDVGGGNDGQSGCVDFDHRPPAHSAVSHYVWVAQCLL